MSTISMSSSPSHHAAWFREMQHKNPVYYDPDHVFLNGTKGGWQLFLHEDVQEALFDHEHFSSSFLPIMDAVPLSRGMPFADEPHHKVLRSLLSKSFTNTAFESLRPFILSKSNELLDTFIADNEVDFHKAFSLSLPVKVIEKMLDISFPSEEQVNKWTRAVLGEDAITKGPEAFLRAQEEMTIFFMSVIESRIWQPEDDMISALLQTEIEGKKVELMDVLSNCHVIMIGGTETTVNLLSNAILTLAEHPEIQERLAGNPSDIPKAINEILRYRTSIQSLARVVRKERVIRGEKLKEGDAVNLWLGAANFDPAVFSDPLIFNIDRVNHSKILSFGHGIHYCLGAQLAKMEAEIALNVILRRIKDIRIKEDANVKRSNSRMVYGLQELPITFGHVES